MKYFEKIFHTVVFSMFIGLMSSFAFAADPVKVGFIYVGPIGDHGWTYRHDIGRQQVEEALGDQVDTMYLESVQYGPEAETAIRTMAQGGADIIFATSFGYMDPMLKVAKDFPDVKEDTPIKLDGITFTDDYEGALEARRTIIYTLDFEMKVNLYKKTPETGKIINQVDVSMFDLDDTDALYELFSYDSSII